MTLQDKIPVGILYSQTGFYGPVGHEMTRGILLAIEEINGMDWGFQLDPVEFDPGGKLDAYYEYCQQMLARHEVRHIVGCYTSASRKRVLPLIENSNSLLWHSARYEGFESSENVIYVGAAPNQHVVPLARYMLGNFGNEVFCVGSNYIWTWEMNRVLQSIVAESGGHIVKENLIPLGDPDIDAVLDDIRRLRPKIIFNTLVGETSYRFFRAFHELRQAEALDATIFSCSLTEPELGLIGPEASVGHVVSAPYFASIERPQNLKFVRRYRARFGATASPSVDAEASYICGLLLGRAIKRAGSDEVAAVRRAAYDERIDAPQGEVRIDADSNHCYLWPRLARSAPGYSFECFDAAIAAQRPDPYLVWLSSAEAATPFAAQGGAAGERRPGLRVVK